MAIKNNDQRLELLGIINSMVKSENSQDFDSYLADFNEKAHTDVKNYFDLNWLPIKTEWWELHRNLEMSYKDIQLVLKVDTNIKYAYNKVLIQLQYYPYITIRNVTNTTIECTVMQVTKTEDIIHVTPASCTCFDRINGKKEEHLAAL
ncbi:hypothetical protein TSAR_013073 [Trichomalopsis sarcophagae]|uniref:Uncharacterized protein n=1 Tax=Trichomalopsis sarcophagae TaxID=543379 RepID=A0A232FMJ4_9HYME|nr:hypothetical protein TSAR_013073 [Trichomalopsis sarcophagae]